jgi:hypothetical protein
MIVFATKLTGKKLAAAALAVCAVLWGAVTLTTGEERAVSASAAASSDLHVTLKTNEQRVELLTRYGWTVEETPVLETEVQIPETFDESYTAYNQIQLEQGLDLEKYQGKRAMLYTYAVQNYPTGETGVTANLLVRKNRLIAADISAADADGFVHGILKMPESSTPDTAGQTTAAPQPDAAEQAEPEKTEDAAE